jgi:hypothetical protein
MQLYSLSFSCLKTIVYKEFLLKEEDKLYALIEEEAYLNKIE